MKPCRSVELLIQSVINAESRSRVDNRFLVAPSYRSDVPNRSRNLIGMAPNILIVGATGAIGKPITNQMLSAKSNFGRLAILTSQTTLNDKADEIKLLKRNGVDVFVGDLTVEDDVKKAYASASRDS